MGFNLVNLAITLRSNDASYLLHRLPLLGKKYAVVCRSFSCRWPQRACETCSVQETCGWHLVFGQELTSDPDALKRHQKPPLPFVFSFPVLGLISRDDKEIVCGLVVIGLAISHLEMLLNGFEELLSTQLSPFSAEIVRIACRDYQGFVQCPSGNSRSMTLVPENLVITSTEGLLESRIWGGSELHIQLQSPLRLLRDGCPAVCFEFANFARSVMRRVSSLAYYYGEREYVCDFKELSHQTDDVICTADHFCYSDNKNKKMAGITGSGSFLGDFSGLVPFLVIGSYVHTGKGSSFGMGAYEVVPHDGSIQ